ncbi:putative kelch domain-containing protein 4 [Penaeus vannamei]|uniref:Putative kelch domain-containing protein 4 n=1 Tax=Penaeus vannamei TaxID=6689 RepID=A0A423T8W9_PENVA|nr:putative kelch domain-containing protein 4 [Penaeus vannamei]
MDKAKTTIMEDLVPPPSRRSAFTLTPHPDKDQLILFGGEYFNGSKTFMFNDLFFYTIKQDRWIQVRSPGGPTPRSAHQAVALSQGGGQLWIFGGEFTSQSQSQFHHFRDLWVFHFKTKTWEKIQAPGGPSARSGHRMVALKKNLIVFGGFHDNSFDCKYFNDVHAFNLEEYKWQKLEVSGKGPCPRSACQMVPISDGRVLIYGGYSKQKLKRDVEKGVTHTDMHLLCPDKHDTTGLKWKWQSVKQAGIRPSPRCGFSLAPTGSDKAILFGGVYDELDEDEELEGVFYNDMYQLDLMKPTWHEVDDKKEEKVVSDDGVFTVTVGPSSSSTDKGDEASGGESSEVFMPPPRINAGMVVKKGILYLYGGIYEDGDKQLTLGDFYALDLSKLEEWQTIIALNKEDLECPLFLPPSPLFSPPSRSFSSLSLLSLR